MEPVVLEPADFELIFQGDHLWEIKVRESGLLKLKEAGYDRSMEIDLTIGEFPDGTVMVSVMPRTKTEGEGGGS